MHLQIDLNRIDPPEESDEFDRFCKSLVEFVFKDPNTARVGRGGQKQNGVDISCNPDCGERTFGIQSKKRNQTAGSLTIGDIRKEVEEAKGFKPTLSHFIVATTLSKDANLQEEIRILSEENKKNGFFSVQAWFWEDITDYLLEYDGLYHRWYPEHFERTPTIAVTEVDSIGKRGQKIIEKLITDQAERRSQTARMDLIRDMIDKGNPKTALKELEEIREKEWAKSDNEFKFRILTNIGASNSLLENYKEAAKYFFDASKYNQTGEKSLCNVALAHSLLENHSKALEAVEEALEHHPESERAHQLKIHILGDTKEVSEETIVEVPEEQRKNPGTLLAVATGLRGQGLYEGTMKVLNQILEIDPDNNNAKIALAETELQMILEDETFVHGDQMTEEIKKALESIAQTFEQGWSEVATKEIAERRTKWLLNSSLANLLLRKFDIALAQITEALRHLPREPMYIKHQAIILFEMGEADRAIKQITSIEGYDSKPEIAIPLIGVLAQNKRLEEARSIAMNLVTNIPDEENQETRKEATLALIKIYISLKEFEEVKKIISETRTKKVLNSVVVDVLEARVDFEQGKKEQGLRLLQRAKNSIKDNTAKRDLILLADELYFAEQYSEAGDIIERYADQDTDSEITRKLLNCYYRSDKFKEALDLAKNVTEKNAPTIFLTEIQSFIYEKMGDLQNAKLVCRNHLAEEPEDFSIRIRYMSVLLRSGTEVDLKELDTTLNETDLPKEVSADAWAQFINLNEARSRFSEALLSAYELRRKFFNDPDAHMLYIGLVLRMEDNMTLLQKLEVASLDSAIKLDNDLWYILEDRSDSLLERQEINTEHELFKNAERKGIGEEVSFGTGDFARKHKIVEIKNKFLYALHDSMEGFETRFPGAQKLFGMRVGSEEKVDGKQPAWVDKFFGQIDERNKHIRKIEGFYKEGKLTIGAFAKIAGGSIYEVWAGLMIESEVGVRSSTGTVEELKKGISIVRREPLPMLIVDPIALMTMHNLDIADDVVAYFGRVGIARTVVDSVQQSIADKQGMQSRGYMSVSKQGEKFVRTEISASQIKENIEYLKNIVNWVNDTEKCEILPVNIGEINIKQEEKAEKILGKESSDSISLATQQGSVLYSDDERLRSYAENEIGTEGVWTQILLMELLEKEVISPEKYTDATLKLIQSNYRYTSMNKDILLAAAQKSDWKFVDSLAKVTGMLRDQESNIETSIAVVSELFRDICVLNIEIPKVEKGEFYNGLLSALVEERDKSKVLTLLKQSIDLKMSLHIQCREELHAIMRKWEKENT